MKNNRQTRLIARRQSDSWSPREVRRLGGLRLNEGVPNLDTARPRKEEIGVSGYQMRWKYVHFSKGRVHCSRAHLDSDEGIEGSNSCLKWLESSVLIGEHTKLGSAITWKNK